MRFTTILLILSLSYCCLGQNYQSAESAAYDPANNRFLISNGSNMLARASDGTLSYFGNGSANYGVEVMGNTVFGVKGSNIVGYDLDTEMEVMLIPIPSASFLNGLANDGQGKLYVTDFGSNKIHKIDVTDLANPTSELLAENLPDTPNGILFDEPNNRLLFVGWNTGRIFEYDFATTTITVVLDTGYSNVDGIDDDAYGNYFISSWSPNRITQYDSNFENPMTITVPGISNPADIGYAKAIDTLAIPQGGKVDYIGFDIANNVELVPTNTFGLLAYPNPATSNSFIQFELLEKSRVTLVLYDLNGKLVEVLLDGVQTIGQHKVVLKYVELPSGIYSAVLQTNHQTTSVKIVIE